MTDSGDITPAQLRRELSDDLPPAALPARVRCVAAIPLTPHGKVDRAAVRQLLLETR